MSASLSRATGRNTRTVPEQPVDPDDEWITTLRKKIEQELRPELEQAEADRDAKLAEAGDDEAARQAIETAYNDTKATYITIANMQFTDRLEAEKRRRRGLDPRDSSGVLGQQREQLEAAQRSRVSREGDSSSIDGGLPLGGEGSGSVDEDTYRPARASQEYPRYGQSTARQALRPYGPDSDSASSPSSSLPRHIPVSRRETLDVFDAEQGDLEPGSLGAFGGVSRRQSSGSMNSLRSKHSLWRDGPQISPKDGPVSRTYDFSPSPSTSAPRGGPANGNRSGISTAFAQSPPSPAQPIVQKPVRRDSNASMASSRSGGPGSMPRAGPVAPPYAPRSTVSAYAPAAGPIYTPPPQALSHSPVKKESSTSDFYAPIPPGPSHARSPLPPVSIAPEPPSNIDSFDDEPLLQRPSPDVDTTGKSWSSRSGMQRPMRHRTSSSDFQSRRLNLDARPGSSASKPSPTAGPSSPESYRAPPSSYAASHIRRYEDDPGSGIPIPSPSDRGITAPQASPEWSRTFANRSMMRRKTSFTVDSHNRNTSQSPESSRAPYSAGLGRRGSVSSNKSAKSYGSYAEAYYRNANPNEEWSPMPPYPEQSHDGSASEHSDGEGDDFDEQEFFEDLLLREEEMQKREEELRVKEEEAQRKEDEAKRKEEELKKKEEEAKSKVAEARRKEEEAKRKEIEIKRKEEIARRKEEEVKRKEDDARRKEEDARRKEEGARKMEEDARRTEDEARKMEEEVRKLEEEARRKEMEARRKEEEVRRKEAEMRKKEEEAERKEEEAKKLEEEARRIEEEARLREEEAQRKEDEVRKREEALRLKEEEFERLEQEARRLSDEAKRRAFDLRLKEEEAVRREGEARQMEEEARKREEDARRREDDARRKEEDARRKEDDARRREEYARVRAEEAKQRADEVRHRAEDARVRAEEARIREDILRKREEEFKLKEQELQRREEELERREAQSKRFEEEKRESESLAEFARQERRRLDELVAEQRRIVDEIAAQTEARQKAEELAVRLQEEEAREARLLAEQEEVSRAEYMQQQEEARFADRMAEERRRAEAELAEEMLRAEQLAEERRRAEAHVQEERKRAERAAEERKKADQLAQEERRRAEAAAQLEDRRRQEFARQLEEQRQEEVRRRAEQQRRQDAFGNGTERSGTPYSSSAQAASSRHNSASSANSDRSSTASNSSWQTNSSWTSWASQGSGAASASTQSTAKATPPRRTASASAHAAPSEPSASRRAAEDDYLKWQERQEEQARRQAELFRKEQERLERQRQAKAGQMLTKDAVLQLFEEHERQWLRIQASDTVSWTSFPWPVLRKPFEPEELTTTAIAAYVLNPYSPSDKPEKDRIKEHIRRWHPDRFETKVLSKVRSEDREKVKEGAGQVVRSLNELLTRSA